ncbi:MAG: DNA primase large subunit [Methanobacteriota archaeon]|jgi:DNA primase large subunit
MVSTLLARYPFFEPAREEVAERADQLVDVVDDEVLGRAEERVTMALREGTTGDVGIPDGVPAHVELFSYPVARAVVSIVDEHPVTRRYAWAESVTARDRFRDDLSEEEKRRRSDKRDAKTAGGDGRRAVFNDVVDEFGLEVRREDDGVSIEVGDFLELASGMSDEEWKLVNREVTDGWVRVTRDDVLELSREAVRERVADGLPLFVPEEARDAVAPAVENVREVVADADITTEIDRVEETEFPPCMKTLLAEIREGEHLEHHSRFAITSFLTNIGMETDEIIETYEVNPGFGEEVTRYQTDHIRGDTGPTEYTCPSCSTMVTYGDCRNKDELCETISHPLGYYRKRLEALDDEEGDGGEDDEEGGDEDGQE